jgi:hypothetical protein
MTDSFVPDEAGCQGYESGSKRVNPMKLYIMRSLFMCSVVQYFKS